METLAISAARFRLPWQPSLSTPLVFGYHGNSGRHVDAVHVIAVDERIVSGAAGGGRLLQGRHRLPGQLVQVLDGLLHHRHATQRLK